MKPKKTQPVASIAALKLGKKDDSGNTITDILAKGNEYAVYEIDTSDPEKKLKFQIDGANDTAEKRITDRFTAIKPQYVLAKGLLYRASNFSLAKNRVAHALATALHSDADAARDQFNQLIVEIRTEYQALLWSRVLYLLPGYSFLISFAGMLFGNYLFGFFQWPLLIWDLMLVGLAALMGGVFSQTFTLRSRQFEVDIGRTVYLLFGVERTVIAVISGFLVYFGIKANVLFGFLNAEGTGIYPFLFLSSIAGFSETFIPSILDRFIKDH